MSVDAVVNGRDRRSGVRATAVPRRGRAGREVGYDVICLASIDWTFNWQSHQEIMSRLAGQGHRVLFIENTGIRAVSLKDLSRIRERVRNWWRGVQGFRGERENLVVLSPLLLPFPYAWAARVINRYLLVRSVNRWIAAARFKPVVWSFLPTPLAVDFIDRIDAELVIYHCVADFEQLSPDPERIAESERALIKRSDVVFAQGDELAARAESHPNVRVFAPGVNLAMFLETTVPAPELRDLPRPVVGYVGGLHRHVDFALLEELASGFEGTLALVGPIQADVSRLRRYGNIVLVGPQPHARIGEFIQAFDVGLIPYVSSSYTQTVFPSKLNEYLAMGIPVISTDLPEVTRFNARHGDLVYVASGAGEFRTRIAQALSERRGLRDRRRSAAAENDWSVRVARMWEVIEDAIADKPTVTPLWELRLHRVYRAARRRLVVAVALVLASYFALFESPLPWMVAEPLRVVAAARPADAIVVFAGGVGESGKAGEGYQERLKQAMDLYREGLAPRVIISSGYVNQFREAEVMRDVAIANGLPARDILLETSARNTYENVRFVADILDREQWRAVLLVSSPYHMRRALLTWQKVAPAVTVVAAPVPVARFYEHDSGTRIEQLRAIAHEYAAIASYWWKGWI